MDLDGNQTQFEKQFDELCRGVVESHGLELYHVEYKENSGVLCLTILDPKTQGASIEDCVRIDQALNNFLQTEPLGLEKLILEVSSPGLNRPIRTKKHLEKSIGERVAIKLKKGYIRGNLKAIEEDSLLVEEGSRCHVLPLESIREARWDFV